MKVFVPITDEILYDHPELITAPLRPFKVDQPCLHWLSDAEIEIIEQDPPPLHSASSPA